MLGNLYPTDTSAPLYHADDVELTSNLQDISGIALGSDFAKSYYMGYLPQDSFPESIFGITMPILSSDHKTLKLNNHIKENRPWGYCYFNDYNSNNIQASFQAYYFNASNQFTRYRTASWASVRFINKITTANVSEEDRITAYIHFRIVPSANLDENGSGRSVQTVSHSQSFTLESLRKFVNGQESITCTLSQTYVSTTKIVNYSDFDSDTMTMHYTEGDYDVYCQLRNFTIYCGQKYTKSDSTISPNVNILPFFRTHVPEGYGLPEQDAFIVGYSYNDVATDFHYETDNNDESQFYADTGNLPHVTGSTSWASLNKYIYRGKYPLDEIAMEDVVFISSSGTGILKNCLFIDSKSSSGKTFAFHPAMDFKDLLKIAMIRNCIQNNTDFLGLVSQSTYDSSMYVSFFNSDDIPYFDNMLIPQWGAVGNYALDSGLLRPWQLPGNDITENEFNVDDMPEYNPSGDEGEDGDGDNILPPALSGIGDLTGFVTMYAVKADQLANLGNQLWASFTNPDFWNSVSVVLLDTTSIDPSVILNYIVSIRLFPFDLSTVSGASAELPEIFFGRGLAGVLVDTDLTHSIYTLNKCVTRVDGGVLQVPAKYGDFRDMEPCAKMILHVPFAGSCEINPSQVVGKYLTLSYSIDYCTGAFMAQCFVSGDGLPMSYPVATLYGQLGATVQLSASNEMESLQCLAGATIGLATGAMGNIAGALSGAMGVATSLSNNRAIPHTTGKSAGFSSFFEPRVPYIEILYDKYYEPDDYGHVHGYACNTVSKIGDLHGYTVCRNVDTTGLSCETDERLSIKRILESGFFVD